VKCFPYKAIALGDLTNNSKGELESRRSSGGGLFTKLQLRNHSC